MSEEKRQSSKLWEPRSFDACKNTAAPMIAMLGHSELDMEVSDAGMETPESNDCRRVFKKNRDANDVLAATGEGARFSSMNSFRTSCSDADREYIGPTRG